MQRRHATMRHAHIVKQREHGSMRKHAKAPYAQPPAPKPTYTRAHTYIRSRTRKRTCTSKRAHTHTHSHTHTHTHSHTHSHTHAPQTYAPPRCRCAAVCPDRPVTVSDTLTDKSFSCRDTVPKADATDATGVGAWRGKRREGGRHKGRVQGGVIEEGG